MITSDGTVLGTVCRYHSNDWGWSTKTIEETTTATRAYAAQKLLANPEKPL